MHDPAISSAYKQCGINEAIVVGSIAATGQRTPLRFQMAQALSILAIDDTRAPGGPATYGRKVEWDI